MTANDTTIALDIPLQRTHVTTLRLVCSSFCSALNRTIDEGDDVKTCASEAALILMRAGYTRLFAEFDADEGITLALCGKKPDPAKATADDYDYENILSFAILDELTQRYESTENENSRTIRLFFGR